MERCSGSRGLTEDAMPLQRTGLGQVGYDAQTLPSLPAIIAAQVWIAAMATRQRRLIKAGRCRQ